MTLHYVTLNMFCIKNQTIFTFIYTFLLHLFILKVVKACQQQPTSTQVPFAYWGNTLNNVQLPEVLKCNSQYCLNQTNTNSEIL